jgi:small GTP-binding protein
MIMPRKRSLKYKICLLGEHKVGKTCLIRRYVFNEFSDGYITTIGAKVTKKTIETRHPDTKEPIALDLMIWDIMGQQGFRRLLQNSYFYGAQGIVAVCDNTREDTLPQLEGWIEGIQKITEEIPSVFLGNKCDLVELQQIGLSELESFAAQYESSETLMSSAKTGENVESAFSILGKHLLEETLEYEKK